MRVPAITEFRREILEALGPLDQWAHRCHEASLHLVKSGVLGPARVARGSCRGVGGQHSWAVLGGDCYDRHAQIVDPTLWSYDPTVEGVWFGTMDRGGRHHPHGAGLILAWDRPARADEAGEEPFELTPRRPWSDDARRFLASLGPLSIAGWAQLAHAPVEGWPAAEIVDAICESGLGAYVPIDIVGMLTDRNPGGLYLP